MPDKKQERLIRLAQKGGNDATLLLLDMVNDLEDELDRKDSEIRENIKEIRQIVTKQPNDPEEIAMSIVARLAKLKQGDTGEKGDTGERGEKGDSIVGQAGRDGIDGKDGKNGADGRNGIDGRDGVDGKDADPQEVAEMVEKNIPTMNEAIRDGLELLEGEERLSHKAIKGLEDLLKNLESKIPSRVMTPRYVHVPYVDDFSDSTDGSTKSFTLTKSPKSITKMLVHGSDFPMILRPTTDFTMAGKTLTLTAQVDAPSSGSTLIAHYYV